ncbi:hypothetical protein EC836_105223 [Erwinia sp. JUb26]|nr:hypothetical protein EC836_105223 [Erwinia sp. JUb26]
MCGLFGRSLAGADNDRRGAGRSGIYEWGYRYGQIAGSP